MIMAEQPNTQPRMNNRSKYAMQKCQLGAAVGGLIPFFAYGIFYTWGVLAISRCWYIDGYTRLINCYTWHAFVAFFIGIAGGTVIGFSMIRRYKKLVIYATSALIILGSGALLLLRNDDYFVTASMSRYMGGIGLGISLFTMLIHLPEVASKHLRGSIVAGVSCILASSYFVIGSMNVLVDTLSEIDNIFFGAMIILFSLLGLCLIPCLTLESPVCLIQNEQEQLALNTLMYLRLQTQDTYELHGELQELKDYINDEKCSEIVKFTDEGRFWFIRILLLRILYVASSSVFLTDTFWNTREVSEYVSPEIHMCSRLIFELPVFYFVEKIGRRRLFYWSSISCGFTMALMSLILLLFGSSVLERELIALSVLSTAYQAFIGLGIAPISLIYLSELFSFKRKASAIMLILIIENMLQIFFAIPLDWNWNESLVFILVASAQIGGGYYFHKVMPETKGLSLRECLHALN